MSTAILPDIVDEAIRVVDEATARGRCLRLLGGVAVRVHARDELPAALARPYADIDLATERKAGRHALELLESLGYASNERFNAINGDSRLLLYDLENKRQVDVFIGEFRMCHRVPLERLSLEPRTIPLAELLMTKLQIVELNVKDVVDVLAILHEHDVGDHDDDTINAELIAEWLSGDWGLWRTTRGSIEVVRDHLGAMSLSDDDRRRLEDRLSRLWERVERRPKSLRWRSRAKVGDRARWYEEPEQAVRPAEA